MDVAAVHTAYSDHPANAGQTILPNLAPSAQADGKAGNVNRRSRRRPRKFRKQPPGEPSPSSEWHAWRREHGGQLETVFQEHPGAYELFRQAVKSAPETLEEWQQSRVRWRPWVEWREQHPGPLHEVLADPAGWELFREMRAQKNLPVNVSYDEWLLLPEQQQQIRSSQWTAWRREHPGPQVLALLLAAETPGGVDEGWQIYRSLQELKGESVPQSFEEWRALPKIRREAAISSWALWRQNHEGRLHDVLADPEGWKLYKEMILVLPTGSGGRGNHNGAGSRQLPATYEDWVQRPEQQLTIATLAWTAWREQHPGKLQAVLSDPEGWTLFRDLKTKSLIVAARTAQIAGDNGTLLKSRRSRRNGDRAKSRYRRKGTPSTLATAVATPITTATSANATGVLAVDEVNDDVEVKGGISTADEEQQQVRSTTAEETVDITAFPETYADWLTWRREKNRRRADAKPEEGEENKLYAPQLDAKKRWQRWRAEHRGQLEEILATEPEGWQLYSAWMSRNGEKPFFSDFSSWRDVHLANRAWLRWREQHAGVLAVVLQNNPDGWPLYRAHILGLSATNAAAVQGNEQQHRQLPETLQEWLQQPPQMMQLTADAWNTWRREHPGPLRSLLSEQAVAGQGEPCGWHTLRVLLQFYAPADVGTIEREDARRGAGASDLAGQQPLDLLLPDSLEAFLLGLKRTSRAAWLRWSQQQRRSNLRTRLRDPVGWALYKVMREGDEAASEFAASYEDWVQKRNEQPVGGPATEVINLGRWSGSRESFGPQATGGVASTQPLGGSAYAAVTAWNRWRRQRRGDLVHVLQKHAKGWQLYCNMLTARNKPVPENFAAFKEAREQQRLQKHAQALREWESWRQQHAGPLEDVLLDPHGARLYRRMIESNSTSSGGTGSDERKSLRSSPQKASSRWLLWREQHPGPLEMVLAENPEAAKLHCAWLASKNRVAAAPPKVRRKKMRGKGGGRNAAADKEAARRWREWRAHHPGALQQVLAADLTSAAERAQTTTGGAGEGGVQMLTTGVGQSLVAGGGCGDGYVTGWQLFCAHAAAAGRRMPASFQEWLEQPQQMAQREFSMWRSRNPGVLSDVLRDREGWQLYVQMKRAAAAAFAEEGLEPPEVIEDYDEWVARGRARREQQNKRRNRHAKAEDGLPGTGAGVGVLGEQTYHCGTYATESRGLPLSVAAGNHGFDTSDAYAGVAPRGGAGSAEARVLDGVVVRGMPAI